LLAQTLGIRSGGKPDDLELVRMRADTSSALCPIDPVEPRIAIRFIRNACRSAG
jgi:hypothetical protein